MNKFFRAFLFSATGLLLATSTSYAHITVNPQSAQPGYGVATVRVPNEKEFPTTSVRIVVPNGATIHGIKAVPGWTYSVIREESKANEAEGHDAGHSEAGRITEVTWTGGQIGAGEFEEFPLSVQYGDPGEYTWKAYQTYSDGETVNWDGGKADSPASVVAVATSTPSATPTQPVVPQNQWLSILAILIALSALFISLRKK